LRIDWINEALMSKWLWIKYREMRGDIIWIWETTVLSGGRLIHYGEVLHTAAERKGAREGLRKLNEELKNSLLDLDPNEVSEILSAPNKP